MSPTNVLMVWRAFLANSWIHGIAILVDFAASIIAVVSLIRLLDSPANGTMHQWTVLAIAVIVHSLLAPFWMSGSIGRANEYMSKDARPTRSNKNCD